MMNYKGVNYEYDEFWESYIIYDENMNPYSVAPSTEEEVKKFIDG